MTKITLTDLANLQNENTAVNAINSNNAVIKTAFDNTLSRDGTVPNTMQSYLDMNSNRILNLPFPSSGTEPARYGDINVLLTGLTSIPVPSDRWTIATGTGDAIVATYNPVVASLSEGLILGFRAPGANTIGNPTFAPNGLTAHPITKAGGLPLGTGEIKTNSEISVRYNFSNTSWEIVNTFVSASTTYNTSTEIATTAVSSNVTAFRTLGYGAAGDGGGALYQRVATQPSNAGKLRSTDRYLPNGSTDNTNGGWWALSSQIVNAMMFGAKNDGSADALSALQNYRDYAFATGSKTMLMLPGTYAISNKLELGLGGLKIIALGTVVFNHTGTGVAISFDAGAAPSNATIFDIEFGWGNDIYVQGNVNTTDLIFIRSCHHMKVGANVRNGTTGMRINFSVLSLIRLVCSGNEGSFTPQPVNALITDVRNPGEQVSDCVFDVIAEGVSGTGLDLNSCMGCEFRGTSEGNSGGIRVRGTSIRNTFIAFDCEANGSVSPDWNIEGLNNTFIQCIGALTTSVPQNIVSGSFNQFQGGLFQNMVIHSSSAHNYLRCVNLTGTPTFGSATAVYESCFNASNVVVP